MSNKIKARVVQKQQISDFVIFGNGFDRDQFTNWGDFLESILGAIHTDSEGDMNEMVNVVITLYSRSVNVLTPRATDTSGSC